MVAINKLKDTPTWFKMSITLENPQPPPTIFIQENAFENVVCEMAAILSWPQCVNGSEALFIPHSQYHDK